jgi:hypothetical protein
VRFANDWVVARSGWELNDGVVALRSGGPANHEHADRNSVIFKAYGERLFHDPYKAAYPYTDPLWLLRKTEAHTALLIDGKGHQYHDGHEGTNASWAEAKIVAYHSFADAMIVTSDATEAYRLVNPDVELVQRTLVFLKPDVLALLDRVTLRTGALPVQVRFQVDNSDGKGAVASDGASFTVQRPLAALRAAVLSASQATVRKGALDLPAEKGIYPFAEIVSAASLEHTVLTLCNVQRGGAPPAPLRVRREGNNWYCEGTHNGRTIAATISVEGDVPHVTYRNGQ